MNPKELSYRNWKDAAEAAKKLMKYISVEYEMTAPTDKIYHKVLVPSGESSETIK